MWQLAADGNDRLAHFLYYLKRTKQPQQFAASNVHFNLQQAVAPDWMGRIDLGGQTYSYHGVFFKGRATSEGITRRLFLDEYERVRWVAGLCRLIISFSVYSYNDHTYTVTLPPNPTASISWHTHMRTASPVEDLSRLCLELFLVLFDTMYIVH